MTPEAFRVRKFRRETEDVFTLELVPKGRKRKLDFSAGQFNMLYAFGAGEVPISISGNASESGGFVHTIRAVGPTTQALQRLKPRAQVGVRGPFGVPWPLDKAKGKDVVILAGGIGLPPLRPVIYHVLSHRKDYGRLVILYGARQPKDVLFPSELARWKKKKDVQVEVTVDSADPSWMGNVGVVPKLIQLAAFDPFNTVAMMCGPEIMMRYAIEGLKTRGISDDRIFVSLERNMKCAVGFCGHCQYGSEFICKDGPVFPYARVSSVFLRKEF